MPAPSTRPTRFVLLAVGHLVFAGIALVWTVALVAGLAFATAAGSSAAGTSAAGVATVTTVAALNGVKIPLLVSGAIGLLRCARWGFYATVGYGLLAIGEAVILYSTRASALLVAALLVYPVTTLILITSPAARRAAGVR